MVEADSTLCFKKIPCPSLIDPLEADILEVVPSSLSEKNELLS